MPEPSDRSLVLRTLAGEANAFGQLVKRYQTSVYNVCYRMMGAQQPAEDMTQEAFLRAYERLHTFDSARPFGPWIRTIATNHCLNNLKRKQPVLVPLDDSQSQGDPNTNPEKRALRREQADKVRRAMQQLSPADRAVMELRHFQGMRYEEIAGELGLSVGAVKSRLYRARKELAEILKSYD